MQLSRLFVIKRPCGMYKAPVLVELLYETTYLLRSGYMELPLLLQAGLSVRLVGMFKWVKMVSPKLGYSTDPACQLDC